MSANSSSSLHFQRLNHLSDPVAKTRVGRAVFVTVLSPVTDNGWLSPRPLLASLCWTSTIRQVIGDNSLLGVGLVHSMQMVTPK
ncbi:hypothetical protein J6590_017455 [Homalodisca vitripennis]|nr:hypothetical protein J6590_017455 [Homalodisca vitripennis]